MRLIAALLLCLSYAAAQPVEISGIVVDPSGAPVPGVIVSVSGRESITDAEGAFRFPAPKPGAYEVKIQQPPFKPVTRSIRISAATPATPLRIALELAEVRNEVTVTESAVEVSTSPGDNLSSVTVTGEDLKGLPVLGSDYLSVLQELVGGAGSDPGGTTVVVDGVEVDARSVPIEAIQQVRINRDPYTAEFSRPGRGRIEITTRDATSDFHGSISVGVRNSALDARNAFAPQRPDEQRRLFTGHLTGPLDRSGRTSFMIAAERQDENLQSLVYAQTPNGLLNQQARAPQASSEYMIKVRRLIGDKQVLTFRFDREHETADNQGIGGSRLPEVAYTERETDSAFRVQHTAFLSANLISDLSLEFESSHSRSESVSPGVRTLSVADAFVAGGAQVNERSSEKEVSLKYVLSYSQGRHLIRGGIDIPDFAWQTYQDLGNRQGTYQFASLADYAAGRPFAFTQQLGDGRVSLRQRTFGLFLQDNINLRPGLTVGLGMRYDRQNLLSDANNIAPRVSVAWTPGQQRKTVIRAGFGVFYDNLDSDVVQDVRLLGSGEFRRLIVSNPSWPEPLLTDGGRMLPPPAIVRMAADLRTPYTLHYTLAVEHKLTERVTASATWTRFRGVSMYRSRDVNAPVAPTWQRPDPAFGIIRQVESSGTLESQSLELGLSGRLAKFFTGSVRYELGRVMSNVDNESSLPANSYNLQSEWSRSNRDRRHTVRALGTMRVRDWFESGFVMSAGTGAPYSLTTGRDENQDGVASDRPLGIPRNTLQGPGFVRLDLRLSKEIGLSGARGDGPRMELTADAFNVLNQVNYAGYVGNLSSPFFGLPVSAQPARRLQLGMRFTF
ncbi:MAG TPA: TonB-dependent receptor [Bryobacteraceae bacterium]|nr:TonB-dependent receptor [Bryobacteraceae bacterium]